MTELEELRRARPNPIREESWRTPFERDADRVLYSSAFRRLRDVTQVLRPGVTHAAHDRLLHSIKVAQVGRRLAQFLKFQIDESSEKLPFAIEPDAVYSAGLAHDLGHPPFGHIGEDEIQKSLAINQQANARGLPGLTDSFEGNAQSLRIVTRLSFRSMSAGQSAGLNLTWATLAALLKYPWEKGHQPPDWSRRKWGAYGSELAFLEGARATIPDGWIRSVEASIMDWADDITYAVHDVEDFIRSGLIPIHELTSSAIEQQDFVAYCATRNDPDLNAHDKSDVLESLRRIMSGGPERSYRGGRLDRQVMHSWASSRIDFFSDRCRVDPTTGLLRVPPEVKLQNSIMKQLVWFYVVDHPSLSAEHQGQRRVITDLIQDVYEWAYSLTESGHDLEVPQQSELRKFPSRLVDFASISMRTGLAPGAELPNASRALMRAVIDYIASLSDHEAISLHGTLASAK